MRKGLYHNLAAVLALSPAVQAAAINGVAVSRKGFQSVMFLINTGAISSAGDFSFKVQESDASGSGYTDAAAADVLGTPPATMAADSAYQIEYIGKKLYSRLAITKAGGTSIAAGAIAILGREHIQLPS